MKGKYLYLIGLAAVILDQISKCLVVRYLPYGEPVSVLGKLVHVTRIHNPGGAFGLFQPMSGWLSFASVLVIAAIVIFSRRKSSMPSLLGVALGLQMGGAFGNLIDRLRFGYVVDFIDFQVWPIFNFADIAISAGIAMLAYYLMFCEGRASTADLSASDHISKE